jgi:hypothetical protein
MFESEGEFLLMANSNNRALFYAAIVVAVLAILVCIYYVIPGYNHVLVTSGDPKATHVKHALAFGAVAVIAIIGALVTRPKAAVR